jgi:hypothetical protein
MLSQIYPSDVFSTGVFSALLPAILIGGILYFAVSLTQRRTPFQTESARDEPGSAENPVLRTLYALALAVLIAAFVGFGIQTFYPAPESLQDNAFAGGAPPSSSGGALPDLQSLPGPSEDDAGFQGDIGGYDQELAAHDRVASVIAIVVAVLILFAGLLPMISRLPVIGDGVTLGGLLTLFYGMTLAVQAPTGPLGFFVVAVGLLALIATLYLKFRPGRNQ